jgi:hypothetical protein
LAIQAHNPGTAIPRVPKTLDEEVVSVLAAAGAVVWLVIEDESTTAA